jgi:hypothetical protein
MPIYEVTTLPTRADKVPRLLARGAAPTDQEARRKLADALVKLGIPSMNAGLLSNQTESVWTDFTEYGVTMRVAQS